MKLSTDRMGDVRFLKGITFSENPWPFGFPLLLSYLIELFPFGLSRGMGILYLVVSTIPICTPLKDIDSNVVRAIIVGNKTS